jgi:hypothetical protein
MESSPLFQRSITPDSKANGSFDIKISLDVPQSSSTKEPAQWGNAVILPEEICLKK